MTDNEVNDIIAEYMGLKVLEHAHPLGRNTRFEVLLTMR